MTQPTLTNQAAQVLLAKLDVVETVALTRFIDKGLSNHNFYIQTEAGRDYILKRYRASVPDLSLNIHQQMSVNGFSSMLVAARSEHKLALFKYVSVARSANKDDVTSLLSPLSFLHQLQLSSDRFELLNAFEPYRTSNAYLRFETLINSALSEVAQHHATLGLCHNDLTLDNILISSQRPLLIDFDYAKVGDVFFDLAALSHTFKLNESERLKLIEQYAKQNTLSQLKDPLKKLDAFIVLYRVLCICWYEQQGYRGLAQEIALAL